MDRETRRIVESYRRDEAGPLENQVIDELLGGEVDRQEFLQRATMYGLGAGTIGALLAVAGERSLAYGAPLEAVQAGGTIRLGIPVFGASLEPYLLNEGGSLAFAGIPGEYLTFTTPTGNVAPWLAASWRPNADATVWTFQLRRGVRFHNGKEMTSADVVASLKHYVSTGSNAGLGPSYDASGVSARGRYTVVVRLKSPTGVFPYLLSQTTYQAIIQPASIAAKPGTWVAERDDRNRPVQASKVRRQAQRRARPAQRVLGRPSAARRRADHVLPGQRTAGAGAASGADRPGDAALAPGRPAVQEQLEVQLLPTRYGVPPAGVHANRHRAVPGCTGSPCCRTRDQPPAAGSANHARRGSGRQRQPVLARVRLDRPDDQAAHAEPRSSRGHCCRRRVRRT